MPSCLRSPTCIKYFFFADAPGHCHSALRGLVVRPAARATLSYALPKVHYSCNVAVASSNVAYIAITFRSIASYCIVTSKGRKNCNNCTRSSDSDISLRLVNITIIRSIDDNGDGDSVFISTLNLNILPTIPARLVNAALYVASSIASGQS
ncbi:hypothetical protein CC78DRAFT_29386 [Lojkania enalia]|uniref:Uncharacterized protein n=1 Tax=Lojkania enalia TaxID=147567 RepID=A0A9P4JZV9_9PLEO|nr:hypothetical protein CC78DRAFT_29386 [Didymosphaeria enalia]